MRKWHLNLSSLISIGILLTFVWLCTSCRPGCGTGLNESISSKPGGSRSGINFASNIALRLNGLDVIINGCIDSIRWRPGSGPNEIIFASNMGLVLSEDVEENDYPSPGDVIPVDTSVISNTALCFGDGTCAETLNFIITSVDPANNRLFGTATVSHTYAEPGTYTAYIASCCRIVRASDDCVDPPVTHINNPLGIYRVETIVDVGGGNSSPVCNMPPLVICPENGLCTFTVPATDPDGDPLTFRLSTDVEASGKTNGFRQPGPPYAPNAASIDPNTGIYTWDTTGASLTSNVGDCPETLYSTQVTVEDQTSKVALDFLIKLVPADGVPPTFNMPIPPECGSTLTLPAGGSLTFGVQASDADAVQAVTLNAVGLPAGATMTPSLPTTGNPVYSTCSWTPTTEQEGSYVVTFIATDDAEQQTLCSLTVEVLQCSCSGDSPKGCISGRVTYGSGDQPLVGKTVKLVKVKPRRARMRMKTVTDEGGCYRFSDLYDGKYKIIVKCGGRRKKQKKWIVNEKRVNNVDFWCKKAILK